LIFSGCLSPLKLAWLKLRDSHKYSTTCAFNDTSSPQFTIFLELIASLHYCLQVVLTGSSSTGTAGVSAAIFSHFLVSRRGTSLSV